MLFKRFLAGFVSVMPFVALTSRNVKYYPEEIFVNDWKIIGHAIRKILKKEEQNVK